MKMKGKGEKGRSWAEEIRDEDLDIAAEKYENEESELESAYRAELDDGLADAYEAGCKIEMNAYGAEGPEPYENDLEERGNQESFEASMAELDADNYLAQYDE